MLTSRISASADVICRSIRCFRNILVVYTRFKIYDSSAQMENRSTDGKSHPNVPETIEWQITSAEAEIHELNVK